jgi:SAM-dependent methyltransferase
MKKKCRVCHGDLFKKPILIYKNMPAAAQNLPERKDLNKDNGVDLNVYQCGNCGLVQLDSKPVPYYKEVIRASAYSDEMKQFRIKQFSEFLRKYSLQNKKIIELGCGKGEYLVLMKQSGGLTYGLEYSSESVKECIKNGLKVEKGFIENNKQQLDHGPFDAFFVLNFLEHLPDLNTFLGGIRNNLSDNAVGLIEVPNFDMILKKNLFFEFTRDHLYYFTKDSLETTLELNGFEIVESGVVWHDYIISAVIRKRKKLDLSHFYNYQKNLKTEIDKYVRKNKKVAVWGAGHEALAVMSMMNLSGKIKYVVDSAPFKQGKFTPATHIPIVSPNNLDKDPVEAVIIMAASYSDEVTKIIKQKYHDKMKIVILRGYNLEYI